MTQLTVKDTAEDSMLTLQQIMVTEEGQDAVRDSTPT